MQVGVSFDAEAAGRSARAAGGGLPQVLPVCGGSGCPWHLAYSLLHMGCYWPYQVGLLSEFGYVTGALHCQQPQDLLPTPLTVRKQPASRTFSLLYSNKPFGLLKRTDGLVRVCMYAQVPA